MHIELCACFLLELMQFFFFFSLRGKAGAKHKAEERRGEKIVLRVVTDCYVVVVFFVFAIVKFYEIDLKGQHKRRVVKTNTIA